MVNFGPLAAEIVSLVWDTPPHFNWQRYCTAYSSGRHPNFAALNKGRHLRSAGRPSRWPTFLVNFKFKMAKYQAFGVSSVSAATSLPSNKHGGFYAFMNGGVMRQRRRSIIASLYGHRSAATRTIVKYSSRPPINFATTNIPVYRRSISKLQSSNIVTDMLHVAKQIGDFCGGF